MTKSISTIKPSKGSLVWINIVNAQKKEIDYLKRKYKFNEIDLEDSFGNQYSQRPKFYNRNSYSFLVLQFPILDKSNRSIESAEIDFYIGKDFIITVHNNDLPPLTKIFNLCANDEFYRNQYLGGSNASLIYEIIIELQEYCYPLLDYISLDSKNIEKNIFAGHERRMVNEILYVKRNILNFRKIMDDHKTIIQKIIRDKSTHFNVLKYKMYYMNLIEHSKNIWEILESHKEIIESLENTNITLVSFKLNDIMRVLTIFSVIVFPLTLLAAIFGMNTMNSMPFVDSQFDFWIIIIIMLVGTTLMFGFFKYKKWL